MSDFRRIDLGGRARTPGRKAEPPVLTWLQIDMLRIDDSYQRPLGNGNWKHIEAIAAEFDWKNFAPILAAPLEGGLFAIIDGQHRAHAASLRGFDEVPAMVVPMTRVEQARAFARVNGQVTAITVFHVYKAAIAAGEAWALDARAAVEAAGCRLMTSNSSTANKKPGEIYPIGLIREHVEAGRGEMITAVLAAIAGSRIGGDPFAYSNTVLKPLFSVLAALADWRVVDLVWFLEENDLVDIHDRVVVMQRNRDELRRQPASKIYRETLMALVKKQVRARAAAE